MVSGVGFTPGQPNVLTVDEIVRRKASYLPFISLKDVIIPPNFIDNPDRINFMDDSGTGHFEYQLNLILDTVAAYDNNVAGLRLDIVRENPADGSFFSLGDEDLQARLSYFIDFADLIELAPEIIFGAPEPVMRPVSKQYNCHYVESLENNIPDNYLDFGASYFFRQHLLREENAFSIESIPHDSSKFNSSIEKISRGFLKKGIRVSNLLSNPISVHPLITSKLALSYSRNGVLGFVSEENKDPSYSNNEILLGDIPSLNETSFIKKRLELGKKISPGVSDEEVMSVAGRIVNAQENNEIRVYSKDFSSKVCKIDSRIRIPRAIGYSDFHLRVRLCFSSLDEETGRVTIRPDEVIAPSAYYSISHSSMVSKLVSVAEIPPRLHLINKSPGSFTFQVEKLDPSSAPVLVFRQAYSNETGRFGPTEMAYSTENIPEEGSSFRFTDNDLDNFYPNVFVYKVCQVSPSGEIGPSSSLVCEGVQDTRLVFNRHDYSSLSILAFNSGDGIDVLVENVDDEVSAIKIVRENIKNGISSDRKIVFTARKTIEGDATNPIETVSFSDSDIRNGAMYRYSALILGENGIYYPSVEEEFVERIEPANGQDLFDISLSPIPSESSGGTISFQLSARPRDNIISSLSRVIEAAGNQNEDLAGSRSMAMADSLKNELPIFMCEVLNNETGQKQFIGNHRPGTATITGHPFGRDCTYIFTLCIVAPVELIPYNPNDPLVKTNSFQGVNKKFSSALARRFGIMPSIFNTGKSENDTVFLGRTQKIMTYRSIQEPLPGLSIDLSIDADEESVLDKNILRWNVTGTSSGPGKDIDYFIVECQYNNNKTTIGTVEFAKINFAEEHSFYFVDSTFYREVGSKTYRVIGVMTDQSSLIYSNSVIASKHFNVSSEFLNLSLDYLGMGV